MKKNIHLLRMNKIHVKNINNTSFTVLFIELQKWKLIETKHSDHNHIYITCECLNKVS